MSGRLIAFVPVFLVACHSGEIDPDYLVELDSWKTERASELMTEDGFLSLTGLFWLEEGMNTYGSGSDNQIIFPVNAPLRLGTILNDKDSVYAISIDGDTLHMNPVDKNPPTINIGTLSWHIIKRAKRFAIRLRDSESETRRNFQHLEYYPVNPYWNVISTFVPFGEPTEISIENKAGYTTLIPSPGQLLFKVDGINYSLDVMEEEKDFFIIFGDLTNGNETYGAGRYLHAPKPDENGKVRLDFNKSYNPPCVFTEFATCPLPPPQNVMKVKIEAGELMYGGTH